MSRKKTEPADYIVPLYINGLEGRMIRVPARRKQKREVLIIYGQHSSIERMWGLIQFLSRYANVTMPDLPGHGGMTSLYKIGQKPTIDNLADYLAAFIKLRYKNKKVTIAAMSVGFAVVTRMLQKYPHLTTKVEMLVSIVGFTHKDDFKFGRLRFAFYKYGSYLFSGRTGSWIFRHTFLQPAYLRRAYAHSNNAKDRLQHLSGDEFNRMMDMEIELWQANDIRTQLKVNTQMFTLDNTKIRVDLPIWHVAAKNDQYFDHVRVEQNMRRIFNSFTSYYAAPPAHSPTVIADEQQAAELMPKEILKAWLKKT